MRPAGQGGFRANPNTTTNNDNYFQQDGVTKVGAGTMTLSGANTYSGPTNIGGGIQGANPNIANGRIVLNDQSQLGGNGRSLGQWHSLTFRRSNGAGNMQMNQSQQSGGQQSQSYAFGPGGRGGRGGRSYGGQGGQVDDQRRELAQYQQKLAEGNNTGLQSTLGSQPPNSGVGKTTATMQGAGQSGRLLRNPMWNV